MLIEAMIANTKHGFTTIVFSFVLLTKVLASYILCECFMQTSVNFMITPYFNTAYIKDL